MNGQYQYEHHQSASPQDTDSGVCGGVSRRDGGAGCDTLPAPYVPDTLTGDIQSNSPSPIPSSNSRCKKDLRFGFGGYDGGCEVGLEGTWDTTAFQNLVKKLDTAKEEAVNSDSADTECILAGRQVIVFASGANEGLHYKYRIQFDGVVLLIHHNPPKNRQAVRLRYTTAALLANSFQAVHTHILDFLKTLGFSVVRDVPSRVDFEVMLDVPVSEFHRFEENDFCVSKLRKGGWAFSGNGKKKKYETLTLGSKKKVQLCIYDKRREMNGRKVLEQKDVLLMEAVGTDWLNSNRPITRVEFRLGRSALKAFSVNNMQDLFDREQAIVNKLTYDWFRILAKPKVRGAENIAEVHLVWERVRSLFLRYFSGNAVKEVQWEKPAATACDATALKKQGFGCLMKAAALERGRQKNPYRIEDAIREWFEGVRFLCLEKVNRIAQRTEALTGISLKLPLVPAACPAGG